MNEEEIFQVAADLPAAERAELLAALRGVDYIFHAAALKQVPSCEFYPMEAVQTNVQGAENVSHGCVNLAPRDARWLYFWSDPQVPPVTLRLAPSARWHRIQNARQ